jgi:hypothetical protein
MVCFYFAVDVVELVDTILNFEDFAVAGGFIRRRLIA